MSSSQPVPTNPDVVSIFTESSTGGAGGEVVATSSDPVDQALRAITASVFHPSRRNALGHGRSMPSRRTVGVLLEAARVDGVGKLLHVGVGSGYLTAVASHLARAVFGIEKLAPMAEQARKGLATLGIGNVTIRVGDGFSGWSEEAPFDAIIVTAACHGAPPRLLAQLAIDGRLVYCDGRDRSKLTVYRITRRKGGQLDHEELGTVDMASGDAPEGGGSSGSSTQPADAEAETPLQRRRSEAERHGMVIGVISTLLNQLDAGLSQQLPRAFLSHNRLMPIVRQGKTVVVATTDPQAPIDEISRAFDDCQVQGVLITDAEFRLLWSMVDVAGSVDRSVAPGPAAAAIDLGTQTNLLAKDRALGLFDALLLAAIESRASDLHLERYENRARIRLRVDGELADVERPVISVIDLMALINVIKVKADIDIAEHRLPQGGRIHVRVGDSAFDLRVQTQPALYGEHVVIRLLPQNVRLLSVSEIGFDAVNEAAYRRLLRQPTGMVLVVGPTGSGKSTTIYAGLRELASDISRKVITIEEPIEYSLAGLTQTQVRPEISFGFADAMRSFVRQDPDVILLGEIRDSDSALEAVRASQTGHLVLSTLHCNDTTGSIQRLIDLGLHPNSIASELQAVIAQTLARRICPHCRRPAKPDAALVSELFPHGMPADMKCWEGAGCAECHGRGTRGRIAVVEFLRVDNDLRRAISRQDPSHVIREIALSKGLVGMRASALALVRSGVIALSELPSLLTAERMAAEESAPVRGGPGST